MSNIYPKLVCIGCGKVPTWGRWRLRYSMNTPTDGEICDLEASEDEHTPRINYCDNRDCARYGLVTAVARYVESKE